MQWPKLLFSYISQQELFLKKEIGIRISDTILKNIQLQIDDEKSIITIINF